MFPYRLTVGDEEYRLKLTTAAKIEAEKKLGFSLMEAIGKVDYAETFAVVLWAALQKYHSNWSLVRTYTLVDKLEDEGCTMNEKANIILEIMKVSGFFTREQIAEMEAEDNPQTKKTEEEAI